VDINDSGAVIDAATGVYHAGLTGRVTDTVKVVDSLGNAATYELDLADALSVPGDFVATPSSSYPLAVTGGSGTYGFSLPHNQSGATVSPQGTYTAGGSGGWDLILVTDANGGFPAAIVVEVTGATGTPPTFTIQGQSGSYFQTTSGTVVFFQLTSTLMGGDSIQWQWLIGNGAATFVNPFAAATTSTLVQTAPTRAIFLVTVTGLNQTGVPAVGTVDVLPGP
jgi:hypothetical protein